MKLFDKLEDFLFEDVASSKTVNEEPISKPPIISYDEHVFQSLTSNMWSFNLGIQIVKMYLANALMNVEWNVYKNGKKEVTEAFYKLNYACNCKESTTEFYSKLADKLIDDGRALIVAIGPKNDMTQTELFVADDFRFKNDIELDLRPNIFTEVKIGDTQLYKQFKENETCIYVKMDYLLKISPTFELMNSEFKQIKSKLGKGADKAMGTKLNLEINGQNKNITSKAFAENLQARYKTILEADNGVFVTYTGEKLVDLTEKQRGSEVEQVLNLAKNTITVNENIIKNIGLAYGIPENYMLGKITTDMADASEYFMTHFVKPRLKLLANKFTLFFYEKEEITKNGQVIRPLLETVQFMSVLSKASAIDKLIGSGAYSINEVREKLNDYECEDGDIRVITKNYSDIETFKKGGG